MTWDRKESLLEEKEKMRIRLVILEQQGILLDLQRHDMVKRMNTYKDRIGNIDEELRALS